MVKRWAGYQRLQYCINVAVVGTINQTTGQNADAVVFDLVSAKEFSQLERILVQLFRLGLGSSSMLTLAGSRGTCIASASCAR